jgi:hypothetical protein
MQTRFHAWALPRLDARRSRAREIRVGSGIGTYRLLYCAGIVSVHLPGRSYPVSLSLAASACCSGCHLLCHLACLSSRRFFALISASVLAILEIVGCINESRFILWLPLFGLLVCQESVRL